MIPTRRHVIKHLAKVFDLAVLIVAFGAAVALASSSHGMTITGFLALRIKLANCLLFALLMVVWHNLFVLCGLYVSKRLTTRCAQILEVCKATVLAAVFLFVSARVFNTPNVGAAFVLAFWVVCTVLMIAGRLSAQSILVVMRSRGRNRRHILIVGTNERAIEFATQIQSQG